jgi:hypothetical protein
LEQVVNYDTGVISYFASGGMQAGPIGGAQGNVFGGLIYGKLGTFNQNYSGPFTTVSGSVGLLGGYWQTGGGINVYGGSVGGTLLSALIPVTGGVARTVTSAPLQASSLLSTSGSPIDQAFYAARQMCN